tara:strand:- start:39 stop:569 length:531 start_codon:yes stop_codon:yes gene_type:complete
MNTALITFNNIYCKPVSYSHVAEGWLSWMNDPITTKHIKGRNRNYKKQDLYNYLNKTKSLYFLACYSLTNEYFGNLRIYKFSSQTASFGRLIGKPEYRGRGYGKIMNKLATSLIFEYCNFDAIIVGNQKENYASATSKLETGFSKIDFDTLNELNHPVDIDFDYYILKKSNYLSSN